MSPARVAGFSFWQAFVIRIPAFADEDEDIRLYIAAGWRTNGQCELPPGMFTATHCDRVQQIRCEIAVELHDDLVSVIEAVVHPGGVARRGKRDFL